MGRMMQIKIGYWLVITALNLCQNIWLGTYRLSESRIVKGWILRSLNLIIQLILHNQNHFCRRGLIHIWLDWLFAYILRWEAPWCFYTVVGSFKCSFSFATRFKFTAPQSHLRLTGFIPELVTYRILLHLLQVNNANRSWKASTTGKKSVFSKLIQLL